MKHVVWPPRVVTALASGIRPASLSDSWIAAAVEEDTQNGAPSADAIAQIQAAVQTGQGALQAFFHAYFDMPIPDAVEICVTRYGSGGSYHPLRQSPLSRATAAISIRHDLLFGRTHLHILAHETVHLILAEPLSGLSYQAREAIVDKICSCNELARLFDKPYRIQQSFEGALMKQWETIVPWNAKPTWQPA